MTVAILDAVLRAIDAELAARPPERGGALLGPPGRPLVLRFVADPAARATSASWRPSRGLDAAVKALEQGEGLELKGLVHSHPRGLDRPSAQDVRELAEGLRVNGHLASYLAPIVTAPAAGGLAPHELPLARGKLSLFAAWRARDGTAEVQPVSARILPLQGDLERAARELGGTVPETFVSELGESGPLAGGRIALDGGVELLVLAGDAYPELPPVALVAGPGGAEPLDLVWPLRAPAGDRLVESLRPALAARAPSIGAALLARGAGLVSVALRERRVLVAGCGSVGSYLAEQLARSGVRALALLDPERVEAANLSRTAYEARDVGQPKVLALARRARAVNPAIEVSADARAVEALEPAELDALVRGADLVVAATDDPAAQRALDRFAYARGRPALFVGLYRGAEGGEVILSVAERTACYLCATRARHAAPVAREVDYGTARLAAEVALGADVQHVASAALKLALSLLVRGAPEARLASFAEDVLAGGATYLTLSTVPRYWFYPEVFGDAPGQGAYQSVWLTPSRGEDCPVCGPASFRADPLDVPLRAPSRDAFAASEPRAP